MRAPMFSLHEASVPVFTRYLGQLAGLVAQAEAFVQARGLDARSLLEARLAPTMYPFSTQVEITARFAVRACAPLAGLPLPAQPAPARSFADLTERIGQALAFLAALTPEEMAAAADTPIGSQAGEAQLDLAGRDHLTQYALPNFFFHLTTAYAILRQHGVPVGKGDFDGFHRYAAR